MTAISENVYFNVLNDIVDEYNNTYHKIIKMKPIDVKHDTFVEYNEVFMKKNCRRLIKKNLELKKTENKRKQIICQRERI